MNKADNDRVEKVFAEMKRLGFCTEAFSRIMKARLERKTLQGYAGWDDRRVITDVELATSLFQDANKVVSSIGFQEVPEDLLVDIATRAMFLWLRQVGMTGVHDKVEETL